MRPSSSVLLQQKPYRSENNDKIYKILNQKIAKKHMQCLHFFFLVTARERNPTVLPLLSYRFDCK